MPPQELLSQLMSGYQLSLPPSTLSKVLCPIFEKFFSFTKINVHFGWDDLQFHIDSLSQYKIEKIIAIYG